MNYFEFYEIPMSFKVDAAALKQTFYRNSKKYHPDFYTLESEEKQAEILELSTLNNKAYQTLRNVDLRMKYLLDLKGLLAEEGKNQIPQDFLMEMMELNEALMDLEFDFEETAHQLAIKQLEALEKGLWEAIATVAEQEDIATASGVELEEIKNYYLKKRYLLRIRENLNKFASR